MDYPITGQIQLQKKSLSRVKSNDVRLNFAYVSNQDNSALTLVEAGIGITIVTWHYTSPGIVIVMRPLAEAYDKRSTGFERNESEILDEIERFVAFASTIRWV